MLGRSLLHDPTAPFLGYSPSTGQSIWSATAPTGAGSDTVTLTNGVQVSTLQPAGNYSAHLNFSVIPSYTGTASC